VTGTRVGCAADADRPRALAHLDLAETGRGQLGDERGQELLGEAVDRGVVGRPLVRVARVVSVRS
jgi:hypothetical protein